MACLLLAAAASVRPCLAQVPTVSLVVGTSTSIVDQFGALLDGTDPGAAAYGNVPIKGMLVEILSTADGVIYPPDTAGQPDPRNMLLAMTRIGLGVSPTLQQPARFTTVLSPRPSDFTMIFVRVFNGASLDDASFYGDSEVYTVPSGSHNPFVAHITATDYALDYGDDDGDGLINSLEKSYGSDPNSPDTDGDGQSDLEETLAKTDPLDAESFVELSGIQSMGPTSTELVWPSASGVTYEIYFASNIASGVMAPLPIASVTASNDVTSVTITNAGPGGVGYYRLKVVD